MNWEILDNKDGSYYWHIPRFDAKGEDQPTLELAKIDLIKNLIEKVSTLQDVSHLYWDEY